MLALSDPRWRTYKSGYRRAYDTSEPLRRLFQAEPPKAIWDEFWLELHHQGDVDTASYAVLPYLVDFIRQNPKPDYNPFALIATIELSRTRNRGNPPLPAELEADYLSALYAMPELVYLCSSEPWDAVMTQAVITCLALSRKQYVLARTYYYLDLNTARYWLKEEWDIMTDS